LKNLYESFPFEVKSNNPAQIKNGTVTGCQANQYYFDFDEEILKAKILGAINNNDPTVQTSFAEIVTDPHQAQIIQYCEAYNLQIGYLKTFFEKINYKNQFKFDEIFEMSVTSGQPK